MHAAAVRAHITGVATKIFTSSRMTALPRNWYTAVGGEHHASQGNLVVVADSKADATTLLVERGVGANRAKEMMSSTLMRPRSKSLPTSIALLVEAGVVDLDVPGVYVYKDAVNGREIIEIAPDGDTSVVGRFVYENGVMSARAL